MALYQEAQYGIEQYDNAGALRAGRIPEHQMLTSPAWGVRRLTPTECRRLQGFTDDWNDWQSDSAAYRQLGNAVCVNEAEWLGRQLLAAMEAQ